MPRVAGLPPPHREERGARTQVNSMRKPIRIIALLAVLVLLAGRQSSGASELLVNGAGATFPAPLYRRWFNTFARVDSGATFNYRPIGSGGGITQISSRAVDFGASDAPMTDTELAAAPGKILHFPTVLGADVIAYNLPKLNSPLRLTGPVVAEIYLGRITRWNDQAIAGLNPGVNLPDRPIVVCHRSDGSGTTYIFTDYLSKVSVDWSNKVGRGTSVAWPLGLGGDGNQGVTELLKQTAGAIGYVELIYALDNKLPVAPIRNREGRWVEASVRTVTAAAASAAANLPADFRISITDAPGAESYPMSSFTYLLIYQRQTDAAKGKALLGFIQWMLHEGQTLARPLSYAPLPGKVVAAEETQLKSVILSDNR